MKKIIGLTKIKNESDIIESLCRYAVEFCDALLLYENDSMDSTRDIVQGLIDEGLPIHFVDDIKEDIKKGRIKDSIVAMMQRAFDEFNADIVLTFDADEFLCTTDGRNPRDALERLDETVEYRILWRTYVYQGESADNKLFLPCRFEYYRNPQFDTMTKAVMSRYLYEVKQARPGVACHFLSYPFDPNKKSSEDVSSESHSLYSRFDKGHRDVEVVFSDVLRYAHYPIRSKAQLMSKIIPNWVWQLRAPDREEASTPWKNIYDYFKLHGDISEDAIQKHSLEYTTWQFDEAIKRIKELDGDVVIRNPLPTEFCKGDLRLKYTDYKDMEKTWIKTALTVFEDVLTLLPEREAEAVYLMRQTRQHNYDLRNALDAKDRQIAELTETIAQIYASRSWKLGHFFGRAYRMLRPSS